MFGLITFFLTSSFWIGFIRIKSSKKLNVIFDLDNTLIMSLEKKKYTNIVHSHKPDLILENRVVWIRPWVRPVIFVLDKFTNLYLFTRAEKRYADEILKMSGLVHYFKTCKYKPDCLIDKNVGKFSTSYNKIIKLYNKIISTESTDDKKKFISMIKSYGEKLRSFIKKSVLVDDQITNKVSSQFFYHIEYYHFGMRMDISMIKLLGWMIWKSVFGLKN
jgi:hypothetical protein